MSENLLGSVSAYYEKFNFKRLRLHYENILAQWCPLVREGHSHITQRAVGKNKAREEGRTFGNSLSRSRLSDPLSPSSAHYRSLSRPKRSGVAFGELHGHYALYLWHVCSPAFSLTLSLSLSLHVPRCYPALAPSPCRAYPGRSQAEIRRGGRRVEFRIQPRFRAKYYLHRTSQQVSLDTSIQDPLVQRPR